MQCYIITTSVQWPTYYQQQHILVCTVHTDTWRFTSANLTNTYQSPLTTANVIQADHNQYRTDMALAVQFQESLNSATIVKMTPIPPWLLWNVNISNIYEKLFKQLNNLQHHSHSTGDISNDKKWQPHNVLLVICSMLYHFRDIDWLSSV